MDPHDVQGRVHLAALLFKTAMPQLAKALAASGHAPPRPEEKERLFARLEETAWQMPPELFDGHADDEDAWEEKVLREHEVRARLQAAIEDAVRGRG